MKHPIRLKKCIVVTYIRSEKCSLIMFIRLEKCYFAIIIKETMLKRKIETYLANWKKFE